MKNEFITYEQAVALKELGFDERCFGHYNPNGVFFWKILCSDEDNDHTLSVKDIMEHVADGYVEAPLYQQAFRWFREKHNLCGEVYTVNMGAIDYTFQIRDLYSEDIKHDNFEAYTGGYVGTFLTYEEAESACLDKLIEICKNN